MWLLALSLPTGCTWWFERPTPVVTAEPDPIRPSPPPGRPDPGPQPPPPPVAETVPVARAVPGRPGFVFSPFNNKLIDVKGMPADRLAADPHYPLSEKKYFRVP